MEAQEAKLRFFQYLKDTFQHIQHQIWSTFWVMTHLTDLKRDPRCQKIWGLGATELQKPHKLRFFSILKIDLLGSFWSSVAPRPKIFGSLGPPLGSLPQKGIAFGAEYARRSIFKIEKNLNLGGFWSSVTPRPKFFWPLGHPLGSVRWVITPKVDQIGCWICWKLYLRYWKKSQFGGLLEP